MIRITNEPLLSDLIRWQILLKDNLNLDKIVVREAGGNKLLKWFWKQLARDMTEFTSFESITL